MTETNIAIVNEEYLKDKIYIIRGQKVMLDSDLAKIYGYSTSRFNEQIRRNIEKFDEDFMFQLTKEETIFVMSQNATSRNISMFKGQNGGVRKLPFVFTEKGIYMLMTVLRGDLAIKQSKALIRLFNSMKNYIVENRELLSYKDLELQNIKLEVKDVKKDVETIKDNNKEIRMDLNKVMSNFIDPSLYKHFLILDGNKLETDIAYKKIFRRALKSIIYIDDYVNLKTLSILSLAKANVDITLITDNKAKDSITGYMVNDFITQNKSNKLTLLRSNNKIHDRYIIIDFNTSNETIYHCGTSLKDAGNKITTIQKVEDSSLYKQAINKLLKGPKLII